MGRGDFYNIDRFDSQSAQVGQGWNIGTDHWHNIAIVWDGDSDPGEIKFDFFIDGIHYATFMDVYYSVDLLSNR